MEVNPEPGQWVSAFSLPANHWGFIINAHLNFGKIIGNSWHLHCTHALSVIIPRMLHTVAHLCPTTLCFLSFKRAESLKSTKILWLSSPHTCTFFLETVRGKGCKFLKDQKQAPPSRVLIHLPGALGMAEYTSCSERSLASWSYLHVFSEHMLISLISWMSPNSNSLLSPQSPRCSLVERLTHEIQQMGDWNRRIIQVYINFSLVV